MVGREDGWGNVVRARGCEGVKRIVNIEYWENDYKGPGEMVCPGVRADSWRTYNSFNTQRHVVDIRLQERPLHTTYLLPLVGKQSYRSRHPCHHKQWAEVRGHQRFILQHDGFVKVFV